MKEIKQLLLPNNLYNLNVLELYNTTLKENGGLVDNHNYFSLAMINRILIYNILLKMS